MAKRKTTKRKTTKRKVTGKKTSKKKTAKKRSKRYASPKKKSYEFSCLKRRRVLTVGDENEDVRALQTFLCHMGYLGKQRKAGYFCKGTQDALRYFQKCYGLDDHGEGDKSTLELIQRPHCGVPDQPADGLSSGPAPFVLRGCSYDSTELSFAFLNSTPDVVVDRQREIMREAFDAWAAVTPLRFIEVDANDDPLFPISFERLDHGDGSSFDDGGSINGNTLAHAFYPPPCGGQFSGALHFDEFEQWTDAASPGAIRLLNVAIHEIGHLLGLGHSNVEDAIMFAFYDDNVDSLRQDDINGIQELYGARPAGVAPIRGQLVGSGDSQLHRITAQTGMMHVRLSGPPDQDFDLYVRNGFAPTRIQFDARGFSPTSQEEIQLPVMGGDVFVMADSWRGQGSYELFVDFT